MNIIRLLFFIALVTTINAQELGKWEWQNPKPAGNQLNACIMPNANTIIGFGDGSTMVTSTNGGSDWTVSFIDSLRRNVEDVDMATQNVWYAVGTNGLVIKTTDGGLSGFTLNTGYTDRFYTVDFIDADTGYIGGAAGRLIKTTDGGLTWQDKGSGVTTNIYTLKAVAANNVWFGSSSTSALKQSTDFGSTWVVKTPSGLTQSIWSMFWLTPLKGWVGTQNSSRVYYTSDGGNTWSSSVAYATFIANSMLFVDSLNGFVTSNNGLGNGTIHKTTDGGATFTAAFNSGADYCYGLAGNSSVVYAVGKYGVMYKTTDMGVTWTALHSAITTKTFRRVKFTSEDTGYLVGGSTTTADSLGYIYKTTNGGQSWSLLFSEFRQQAYAISMPTPTTWYVSTGRNRIYKSTDAGTTWNWLTSNPITGTTALNEIAFADSLTGYVVNNAGAIIKTTDGGATWATLTSPHGTTAIYAMHLFSANKVITVGGSALAFMTTDGGATWNALTTNIPGNYFGVNFYDNNYGIITGYNSAGPASVTSKTTDGGLTWTALNIPANHSGAVYASVFEDSLTYQIMDINGITSRTTNGGVSWVQPGQITFGIIYYAVRAGRYLWAAGTGGSLLKSQWTTVIPVELTSFSASVIDGKVNLNWSTATETNNRGFEIHKQSGNGIWQVIGFVNGAGSTTEKHQYSFTDNEALSVKASYRLKQVDFDGSSYYSNVIELDPVSVMTYELGQNYPNPFNPTTKIFYQVANDMPVSIVLYDALGKEVQTLVSGQHNAGKYMIQLNAENLASGTYFYRMDAGNFSQTRKLVLIK